MAYCVFWYPTIYQRKLTVLECYKDENGGLDQSKCFIEKENIADDGIAFELSIKFGEDENITVGFESSTPDQSFEVVLKKEDDNEDGLVLYKFDSSSVPPAHYKDFEDVLRRNVYHNVKRFYHSHEVKDEGDRSIEAFIPQDKDSIDLKKADNKALIYFLESFDKIFCSYAQNISEQNKEIQIIENHLISTENLLDKVRELQQIKEVLLSTYDRKNDDDVYEMQKEFKQSMAIIGRKIVTLSKRCGNALVEYTYYKTLAHSKNNISFCVENTQKQGENTQQAENTQKEKYRRKALNIRNSIRYIENIKYFTQSQFNRFSIYKFEEVEQLQNETRLLQERSNDQLQRLDTALTKVQYAEDFSSIVAWLGVSISITGGLVALGFVIAGFFRGQKTDCEKLILGVLTILVGCVFSGFLIRQKRRYKQ